MNLTRNTQFLVGNQKNESLHFQYFIINELYSGTNVGSIIFLDNKYYNVIYRQKVPTLFDIFNSEFYLEQGVYQCFFL